MHCRGGDVQKKSCEAVVRFEGVVVEEPACDVPALFVVEWLSGAVPADGKDVDSGELVGTSPADEVPGRLAVGGGVGGEPSDKIALLTGLHGEVVGRQPVQEGDGVGALTRGHELLRGKWAAIVASAKPPDQMPDRIPVQNFGSGVSPSWWRRVDGHAWLMETGVRAAEALAPLLIQVQVRAVASQVRLAPPVSKGSAKAVTCRTTSVKSSGRPAAAGPCRRRQAV